MLFADLKLAEPLLRALETEKYETATPIQAQSIPHILAGRDVLGSAQTGTGKTAAFALPILQRLMSTPVGQQAANRKPRVLVLAPTRELATQIATGFKTYGQNIRWLRYSVVFGGVSQHGQVSSLRSGVDVIIACPGRLLDLMNQGFCDLSGIDTLVLDEADRMLDMGFIHDIRRIVAKVPTKRQTLFFSATMPPEIRKLADTLLNHPVTVAVAPVSQVADRIEERVYFVEKTRKPQLLAHLVKDLPMYRAIVFTRTKHGADKVVRKLDAFGIRSAAIHGNKSQNNRNRALHAFKENKIGVLVATDIAARGIDIDGVSHVVNFDLTHEPETYVHRIGRTARAGASGHAISFCDREERENLTAIERLIKRKIEVEATPGTDVLPADPSPREDRRDREPREQRDPRAGGGVRRTEMKPSRGEHHADRRPEHRDHSHAPRQSDGHRQDRHPAPRTGHANAPAAGRGGPRPQHPSHRNDHRPHAPRPASAAGHDRGQRHHDDGPVTAYATRLHAPAKPTGHTGHGGHGTHRPAHAGKPAARHPLHGAGKGVVSHAGGGFKAGKKPHRKGPGKHAGARSHGHAAGYRQGR